jgi:lipid-binding SYLF domain-containing protein
MNTVLINSTSSSPGVTNQSLSRSTHDSSDKSHVSFRDLQSLLSAPLDDGIDSNSVDDVGFRSMSSDDDCGASTSTNDVSLPRSSSKCASLHRISSWAFLEEHHAKHVNSNIPVSLMKKMVKMARDAVVLMEKLEHPISSSTNHTHTPALPPSAIRFSKALVFLWHKKAGVIGSYAWRYGFVIYQISPGIWSAPVFLRHGFVSVGATCGFSSGATLYAISDNAGIVPFIRSKTKYISGDFEFTMATKMDSTGVLGDVDDALVIRSRFVTMSNPSMHDIHCLSPEHPKIRKYDVHDSLISCMVDVSVKCGVESLDYSLNSALYGKDVSARDILDGAVQIPGPMYVVYEYLKKRVSNPSLIMRGTKKLFEEEKARLSLRRGHSAVRRVPMQTDVHTDSDDSIVTSPFPEKERQNSVLFQEAQLLDIDLGDP